MQLFIIRWSAPVLFPDGKTTRIASQYGTRQEAEVYAREIAKEHGVDVECIL